METLNSVEKKEAGPKRRALFFLVFGGLLLGGVVGWWLLDLLQINPFVSPSFHGTVVQLPEPAADFTLTNVNGQKISLSDFRGQVVLLYFGYTYCPDVCPTTLAELRRAKEALGRKGEDTQTIMITVDPARDTPEALANYLSHFDPTFIGLAGTENEIKAAASPLGIFYEKREGSIESGYLVDHTGSVLVIDRQGYLRLLFPVGTPGKEIAADLRLILKE